MIADSFFDNSTTYNISGLPTQIKDSQGNTVGSFSYDINGHLIQSTSATGQVQYFVYDASGNQTLSYYVWTDPNNPQNQETIVSRTDYDRDNRVA